ncbi:MAG: hypothetical protein A2008_11235 [Candidatus Wallbacteria bacterium GWC2_49_35]|uniref:Ion-translocating oxidoreductase complex subunit B n=1 Tax=Candidatus Wallbacteria bacterium GWC2_49_35 TaxID=1817813 RepID=A0A1F7WUU6_9BACT|nr:MAG: hypothetical protein A2008_11235 [Candidatus Wallbacteria bacterium GWC2_49_35]HBC73754.1 ferredoxin [Candidatus Wallbacteria bacterium]
MNEIIMSVLVMGLIAIVLAVALIISSKKFYVPENPLIEKVAALLPQANCGACGFPGCAGFAKAFVEEPVPGMRCPVASAEVLKAIGEVVGRNIAEGKPMRAVLHCNGRHSNVQKVSEYIGIRSCAAAHMLYTGDKACRYSCIGYGDCVKVCLFGAITIEDGISVFDAEKCTGCGLCVKECPRKVISLVQKRISNVRISCSSHDRGPVVRKNCKVGCIACGKCVKVCPKEAITVAPGSNLAIIDDEKCILCGKCVAECDTMHAITADGRVVKAVEIIIKKKQQEKEEKQKAAALAAAGAAGNAAAPDTKEVKS